MNSWPDAEVMAVSRQSQMNRGYWITTVQSFFVAKNFKKSQQQQRGRPTSIRVFKNLLVWNDKPSFRLSFWIFLRTSVKKKAKWLLSRWTYSRTEADRVEESSLLNQRGWREDAWHQIDSAHHLHWGRLVFCKKKAAVACKSRAESRTRFNRLTFEQSTLPVSGEAVEEQVAHQKNHSADCGTDVSWNSWGNNGLQKLFWVCGAVLYFTLTKIRNCSVCWLRNLAQSCLLDDRKLNNTFVTFRGSHQEGGHADWYQNSCSIFVVLVLSPGYEFSHQHHGNHFGALGQDLRYRNDNQFNVESAIESKLSFLQFNIKIEDRAFFSW